ncbi:RNA-directed DNA polymerase [Gregarina niphandrodes]|uniref:RNA-directed DNA polymerase n=1 Tax=Gregarina niphandrodes TaxID=110365 RepID=A0A023AVJ8_GRENI|nr:RNA-directed DNA polymerase [Gregarina niphandrodes]EZG42771.1 RNA-directed DNA polymerase [Gregarina niphandrodes]|eukprot:XP_011133951.1 RNA-directed DNA polymerase [Gregarina niphandrodes]
MPIERGYVKALINPYVVGKRVTHNCQPLYPYTNSDGKFPNAQAIGPVIAWAIGQRVIAKIDLSKAFHAVPIVKQQQPYYSFLDARGRCYCYKKMPMSARTAPKHFANVMSLVLGRLQTDDRINVRSYQDDIIIAANTREELRERYKRVTNHLRSLEFKINPEKPSLADEIGTCERPWT